MNTERRIATQLIVDLKAEIARADTKASILIAAMGLGLGANQFTADQGVLWVLACVAWLAALTSLLMVLLPRYGRAAWTGDAVGLAIRDEQSSLVVAAAELNRIVMLKYRWTRVSLACFATATALTAFSALTA